MDKIIKENGEKGEREKKSDLLSLHLSIFFPLSPYNMFFSYTWTK